MFAEMLLTFLVGGGVIFAVFVLCFNTTKVPTNTTTKGKQQNKKKKKKNKKSNKNANNHIKKPKFVNITPKTIVQMKPKIKIDDHDNLISVFRAHIGEITGIAWHQSGKYLLSASKDKYIYIWENPTDSRVSTTFISSCKTKDNGYFSALHSIITPATNSNEDEKKSDDPFVAWSATSNAIFASTNGSFGLNSYELGMSPISKKVRLQMTRYVTLNHMEIDRSFKLYIHSQ